MKLMVDANVIVSSILFPKSIVAKAFSHMIDNNILVISQYTLDEIDDVFKEKFPHRIDDMKRFMKRISYELFILNKIDKKKYPCIRDIDDLPVLANAIEANIDIFITGDHDFDEINIENPKIIKPRKYIDEYMEKE
jgi:putative PIN family toxin of toxin-antitoxin system